MKSSNNIEEPGQDKLLSVRNLKTYFYTEEGKVKAVDGVSFDIFEDEVLGLVGETGCGKSVTALSILQLVRNPGKIESGEILFKGKNLLNLKEKEMRKYRGKDMTMIFQDPLNSLNPVMKVGTQIGEVFDLHQKDIINKELDQKLIEWKEKVEKRKEIKKKLNDEDFLNELSKEELSDLSKKYEKLSTETKNRPTYKSVLRDNSRRIVDAVGIPDAEGILDRYPHELSGGMRQRVMIAMALSCNPSLLIADEPTTALDVTIQAQILDLMKDLKDEFKTSILMITHDLGIIAEMCDRVAVMYSGNIVEYATAKNLFKDPRHPYTKGLIEAIPTLDKREKDLDTIRGSVPNLIYPPSGCRFHPRCDERLEVCDKVRPPFTEIGDRYYVACHLYDPKYKDSPKYEWGEKELEKSKRV
ncbi:MAG: ATP-binding cassette domain-containing protein [Candidatus Lokiarchaeota archaeon]|nr:ATP-binding cassette domain-containing protein [Candidatus Lokiarchaeota archaeon]MBD3200509.1 ATP-binding cassette domain-containing protein [Candidatus Lokiarchaeota archaeon]